MKNLIFKSTNQKAYITLNRPEAKNALDKNLILELTKLLKKLNKDKTIHAVCLSGSNHFFCAGADLKEMKASLKLSAQKNRAQAKLLSDLLHTLYTLEKPTIAVVEGGVYGGGLGLLACCDIVICSENAQFAFSEAKLGLVPAMISPYIIKTIGERNAKRFFLTAEIFNAKKAHQIGLVHEIVSDEILWKSAEGFMTLFCQNSLPALTAIKKLFPPIKSKDQSNLVNLLSKIRTTPEAQKRLQQFFDEHVKRS